MVRVHDLTLERLLEQERRRCDGRIDRLARARATFHVARAIHRGPVLPEDRERHQQLAAELAVQVPFAGSRLPAHPLEGGSDELPNEGPRSLARIAVEE